MTQLLIGTASLVIGGVALRVAMPKHGKTSQIAGTDALATTVALVITTMISLGIGLLATGIYLVAG